MTLREHLEAIRDETTGITRQRAVAALAILNECQWDAYGKEHLRLVPDPEPSA